MMEAERTSGTDAGTAPATAPVVRTAVVLSATLFFIQLTLLAPGDVENALGFSTGNLGHHWWALATFTLVHTNLWPFVANLTVLATFGAYLERRWGSAAYARYYLLCALGAWVAHVSFAGTDVVLAGAAAPAIGALLAFAATSGSGGLFRIGSLVLTPGWLVTAGTAAILAAGILTSPDATAAAYLAHAGGLVAGWAYLRTVASVDLERLREGVSPVPDEPDEMPRAIPRSHARPQRHEDDIVARSNAAVAEAAARPATAPKRRDASPLNRVLDKISAQGIESLSPEERKLLDELSRKLRDL